MSGNFNSGRKPLEKKKINIASFEKMMNEKGLNSYRKIGAALDVSFNNISRWNKQGWPLYAYNRLIVLLGLNKRQAASKLLRGADK